MKQIQGHLIVQVCQTVKVLNFVFFDPNCILTLYYYKSKSYSHAAFILLGNHFKRIILYMYQSGRQHFFLHQLVVTSSIVITTFPKSKIHIQALLQVGQGVLKSILNLAVSKCSCQFFQSIMILTLYTNLFVFMLFTL